MDKKILILGANGLLGNNIYNFLKNQELRLYTGTRKINNNFKNNFEYGDLSKKNSEKKLEKIMKKLNPNYVINCIGITKHKKSNFVEMKRINYELVYKILLLLKKYKFKYIHLSTDCVFSGKEGLLEWFLSKSKVFGFKKAFFSGPTSLELAKIIFNFILDKNVLKKGIYNIACKKISKFNLLKIVNKVYKKNILIMSNSNFFVDRSLIPNKFINETKYSIPSWGEQIKNMYKFKNEISKK